MNTIKESLSFSTNPFRRLFGVVLFLVLASVSEACGPGPTPYQASQHSPFDPKYPGNQKHFAEGIFSNVLALNNDYISLQKEWESDLERFLLQLTEEINTHRPDLASSFTSTTLPSLGSALRNNRRGWGSCKSNTIENFSGLLTDAITNQSVADDQVMRIISLRQELLLRCSNRNELAVFSDNLSSEHDDKYVNYVHAAALFYQSEFEEAMTLFEQIAKGEPSWVVEASDYLVARSTLRSVPQRFSSNQQYTPTNQAVIQDAIERFNGYLSRYPKGRFSASAKGLIRRAHWMLGDSDTYERLLENSLRELLIQASETPDWADGEPEKFQQLFNEFRRHSDRINPTKPMSLLEILFGDPQVSWKGQKLEDITRINTYASMHNSYFVEDYDKVIEFYLPKLSQLNQLELILLIRATEQSGDRENAAQLWLSEETKSIYSRANLENEIQHEAAESIFQGLGLQALMDELRIEDEHLKFLFVETSCDENFLVSMLEGENTQENKAVLFKSLAGRYLKSQRFDALYSMMESYPDETLGTYTAIETAIRQLVNNRDQGQAYMNIAYFMKQNIAAPDWYSDSFVVSEPAPCSHSPEMHEVAITDVGPSYYFNKSLEFFGDEKSLDEEKSLYYITTCFRTGRTIGTGSCRWGEKYENELSSREAFIRLHDKYKGGEWAQKAKYYY